MNYIEMSRHLRTPESVEKLNLMYGRREGVLVQQIARYSALLKLHEDLFKAEDVFLVSSPGRAEIIGNHTDHNNGRVLAAAVSLDTAAVVSKAPDNKVRLVSEGYEPIAMDLSRLAARPEEEGSTAALVRGVAERMQQLGYQTGGFSGVVTSEVMSGSGLSSSAAFEVLIACILDNLYNRGDMSPVLRAKVGQYAENKHFGKPSGLMDQMAASIGGLIGIDLKAEEPEIEEIAFNFSGSGYALVVVDSGGSHDDLTPQYAAIKQEMQQVAGFFGKDVLQQVRPEQLYQNISLLRKSMGERPLLRAIHFFDENQRVLKAIAALRENRVEDFLEQVRASGSSSWKLLQNLYASPEEQPLCLALTMARHLLEGRGASRLHGGGFAGTTLNFVPLDLLDAFVKGMGEVFGEKSVCILDVRPMGALKVF